MRRLRPAAFACALLLGLSGPAAAEGASSGLPAGAVVDPSQLAPSNTRVLEEAAVLRSAPQPDARALRRLPAGTRVDVLVGRGDWLQVRVLPEGREEGWIRPGEAPLAAAEPQTGGDSGQGGGFFSGLAGFSRGLTGLLGGGSREPQRTGSTTATIGIRGLDADSLATAAPDPAALQRLQGFAVDAAQARAYAREAELASRPVEYPPAAASASAASPTRHER